jgi:hypothetical protein
MATVLTPIKKSYVSSLSDFLDTREINNQVADIQNEDALTDILNFGDRKMIIQTGQPIYRTFVNDKIFLTGDTTGASVQNNNTPTVTTAFTAATSGYVQVGDLVIFPTRAMTGYIYSVSSSSGIDTVVIKSVNGANLATTQGDVLSIFSMAYGERSDAPANVAYGLTAYFNKYQIFSVTSQITDVQNAATIEVTFDGQNKYAMKDHIDKKIKLKGSVNAAFFGSDMSLTSFSDTNPNLVDQNIVSGGGGGGAVQTTRGINKYIELYGTTLNPGNVSFGAIDDALDNLISRRAPKDQLVVGSSKANRIYDVFLKNLGSAGVNSVRLVVDGNEVDFTVNKFTYGGFTINKAMLPILDHPTMFKYVTTISNSMFWLPYDLRVKVYGGGYDPALRVRYVPNQSIYGNEMIGEVYGGANSPINPNGFVEEWKTVMITRQGLEFIAPQFALRQQVV